MATSNKNMRADYQHRYFKPCPECSRPDTTRVTTNEFRREVIFKDAFEKTYSFRCGLCGFATRFFPSEFGAFRAWQLAPIPKLPPVEERHLKEGKFKNCFHCRYDGNSQRGRQVPGYDRRKYVRLIRIRLERNKIQYKFRCVRCQYTPPGEFFSELEAFVAWNRYLQEG